MKISSSFLVVFCSLILLFTFNQSFAKEAKHLLALEQLPQLNQIAKNNKEWNPASVFSRPTFSCEFKTCLPLEKAIERSLAKGFASRAGFESVYQARKRVLMQVGQLLPRLQAELGIGILPESMSSLAGGLVGFALPSNWFSWKESRLVYEAEKQNYLNLLQDEVATIETLYYNMNRFNIEIEIYTFYRNHLQNFIELLKGSTYSGNLSKQTIPLLEQFVRKLEQEIILLANITRAVDSYDLALALAITTEENFGIYPIVLPDLSSSTERSVEDYIEKMLSNSATLKSIDYLKKSSKYAKLSRTFNFFGVGGGSGAESTVGIDFGFDNVVDVSIAKSETRTYDILNDEYKINLKVNLERAVEGYNATLVLDKKYTDSIQANAKLFEGVLEDLKTSQKVDPLLFIKLVEWGLDTELSRNFARHFNLIMQSQMDRFLVEKDVYKNLLKYIPAKGTPHPVSDFLLYREDQLIEKDIKKGILKID